MKKEDIKLEALLTIVGPAQIVRILDETMATKGLTDFEEITIEKGPAAKVFRKVAGSGRMVKHVSPEVEKEGNDYVLHIFVY